MTTVLTFFISLFLLISYQQGRAEDYYVDAAAPDGGNGTLGSPWNSIDEVNAHAFSIGFYPGDHVRFNRNQTYSGNLYILNISGDPDADIVFEAYGTGDLPQLAGMVIIFGQSYITVQNLGIYGSVVGVKIGAQDGVTASNVNILNNDIHDYTNSGVNIIGGGINNVKVSGNAIYNGPIGVYLASDTGNDDPNINKMDDQPLGCNNIIENNIIYNNAIIGIDIDAASLKEYPEQFICNGNGSGKDHNTVRYNEVRDNGCHGLEINANHIVVEHNIFTNNGVSDSYGGCSGIHLFDRWPSESGADSDQFERGGDFNIIRYNISNGNKDRVLNRTDGNGIQLDMWCDHNQVYNNLAYGNDGAGIIVYGSSNNVIFNNTLYGNGLEVGFRYGANEMTVLSADVDYSDASDVRRSNGTYELVSKNNVIKNNIGMATATDNPDNPNYGFIDCRFGDCRYALAVDDYVANDIGDIGNNVFSHNTWFNSQNEDQAIAIIKVSEIEHFQLPVGDVGLAEWETRGGVDNETIAEPLFQDVDNVDFHLLNDLSLSPAVDSGQAQTIFNDDFDGIERPQVLAWDQGAYENVTAITSSQSVDLGPLN